MKNFMKTKALCALAAAAAIASAPAVSASADTSPAKTTPASVSAVSAGNLQGKLLDFEFVQGNTIYGLEFGDFGAGFSASLYASTSQDNDADYIGKWSSPATTKVKSATELEITTDWSGTLPNQTLVYDKTKNTLTVTKTAVVGKESFALPLGKVLGAVQGRETPTGNVYEYLGQPSGDRSVKPFLLTAKTAGADSIALSWDKVDGADKYKVYLFSEGASKNTVWEAFSGKSGEGLFKSVATTTETSYTIKNLAKDTAYTFKVAPVSIKDDRTTVGALSNPAAAKTASPIKVSESDLARKQKFVMNGRNELGSSAPSIELVSYNGDGTIWIENGSDASGIRDYYVGKFTTKTLSPDTLLQIDVAKGEYMSAAPSVYIYDKSKNTLTVKDSVIFKEGEVFYLSVDLPEISN
ncbi:MAG: fibronectin type III domain-containing protein [Clostridiales bacterium]|jgi:hypothetical protein|nr:fibronectin type III domain-containing protein [Clostridiales bacterium]